MHQIEYTGTDLSGPWTIRTSDGQEWHAADETEAAAQLLAFIIQRQA
jgi:hypothetical protein